MASTRIELPALGTEQVPSAAPGRRSLIILLSLMAGAVLAAVWPTSSLDMSFPDKVGSLVLGYNTGSVPISGLLAGAAFAVVAGFANTFTACNFAALSTIGPLSGSSHMSAGAKAVRHLGWLGAGMAIVAGAYGAIGVAVGSGLPQLSAGAMGGGLPPRMVQAAVVYGIVGLAFVYLGLAELRLAPSPFAALSRRLRYAPLLILGGLVGASSIGRPHPMFLKMFSFAAGTHNPGYGALVFVLQALGNLAIIAVVSLVLTYGTRGRFERWMNAKAGRMASITAAAFLVAGIFTFIFWDVRLGG
jgi:hypothetical protein